MKLSQAAARLLQQAEMYLPYLTPTQYSQRPALLQGSSIGQHTRHYLGFFECLISQAVGPDAEIDYTRRQRLTHLETDPEQARQRIRTLASQVLELDEQLPLQLQCRDLQQMSHSTTVPTNVARELVYNIEHTIHHLAIIKIGLALVAPELRIPRQFGTAPSTLAYHASLKR